MAKRFDLSIDRYQAASFVEAVRTKRDVIVLWMNAIKAFLVNQPAVVGQEAAKLSIVIMSMSRLFCELQGGHKIYSTAFPFNVREEAEGMLAFYSREGILIDNRISSEILSLIQGENIFDSVDFSQFIDPIISSADVEPSLWTLLRELMLAEDAYIRYDWDRDRANGHLHPEYHLDLCYSAGSSFKVGLQQAIDRGTFVSILDIEVDCHYLNPPR